MNKYPKSKLLHLIDEWVIGLNATRNKEIIIDKLINGLSIPQIAAKNDLSQTRVKTVIRTFKRTIEEHVE